MGRHRVLCPAGREWSDWSSELRIPGDELKWKFISDGSVNGWGWRFTVYPIMPAAGEGPTAVLVPTWGLGSTGPCCSRSHPGPASRAEPPTCLFCVLAGGSVRCRCGAAAGGCAEETSAVRVQIRDADGGIQVDGALPAAHVSASLLAGEPSPCPARGR